MFSKTGKNLQVAPPFLPVQESSPSLISMTTQEKILVDQEIEQVSSAQYL